jgi:hypothetical protein
MDQDLMYTLANVLLGIGVGISLVVIVLWLTIRRFENGLRDIIKETVDEVEKQLEGIVVEEDAGQLFFYREKDRQFLCQGKDFAEVRSRFKEMYPEKIAYFAGGDPQLVERLKQELAEIKKMENNENSNRVGHTS